MRLLLILLLLFMQPPAPNRIRLLLRDEFDAGVAGATLTLRTADQQTLQLATDANGVAVSGPLSGEAVWLISGRLVDGQALTADSYPPDEGFRLILIPGQTRDALLRLDGTRIVLDPDMIFSPGEPGEPIPPTPPALAATVPLLQAAASVATMAPQAGVPSVVSDRAAAEERSVPQAASSTPLTLIWFVLGLGLLLVGLALLIGLARRRAP